MSLLSQPLPISIILCSRQRVPSLRSLLDSLAANCQNASQYEVLVAYDSDDLETKKFYEWKLGQTKQYLNVRFRAEERVLNLHYRLNKLVRIGRGKLFWVLNDDCLIETSGWDRIIIDSFNDYLKDKPDKIALGKIQCNSVDKIGDYSAFPVITREAVETVGFFMPNEVRFWGNDVFCNELYSGINRIFSIPDIVVNHFLHSNEASQYQNPLRAEILNWHKENNLDLLGDLKSSLKRIKETALPLIERIMLDNNLESYQTKWGIYVNEIKETKWGNKSELTYG